MSYTSTICIAAIRIVDAAPSQCGWWRQLLAAVPVNANIGTSTALAMLIACAESMIYQRHARRSSERVPDVAKGAGPTVRVLLAGLTSGSTSTSRAAARFLLARTAGVD